MACLVAITSTNWGFETVAFYRVELLSLHPNTYPGGPGFYNRDYSCNGGCPCIKSPPFVVEHVLWRPVWLHPACGCTTASIAISFLPCSMQSILPNLSWGFVQTVYLGVARSAHKSQMPGHVGDYIS